MISSIIRARRCKSVKGNVPLWWCLWDTWDKKRLGNTVLIFHSSLDSIMCRVLDPDVIPEMSSSAASLQNKHKLHDVCCRITSVFPSQHGCPLWFCSMCWWVRCVFLSVCSDSLIVRLSVSQPVMSLMSEWTRSWLHAVTQGDFHGFFLFHGLFFCGIIMKPMAKERVCYSLKDSLLLVPLWLWFRGFWI